MAIEKAGIEKWQLRMIYAGDLLAQTIASSFGIMGFDTPIYGLYAVSYTHLRKRGIKEIFLTDIICLHILSTPL